MTYNQYHITVSGNQKEKLENAVKNKKAVCLRLAKANLTGNDICFC